MSARRARKAARGLIRCSPWPGDGATPPDIAQLALLRLLWLQRETHRAARRRQFEATALLARAALETGIAGLYWLYAEDAVVRLGGGNAKALQRMLAYIADGDPITPSVIDDVTAAFGERRDLPTLRHAHSTPPLFAQGISDAMYPVIEFVAFSGDQLTRLGT